MPTWYQYLTSLKVCDWSGHIFGASAIPTNRSLTKKMAMPPSSTVHGGQHDTKYVTFELLMHAAFVADEIWGFMPEPARSVPPFYGASSVRERTAKSVLTIIPFYVRLQPTRSRGQMAN